MTCFDELKNDEGYRKSIETSRNDMYSSHVMKRFFNASKNMMFKKLQRILLKLFIWRLSKEKPEVIILGLDTMVLNNNYANKRIGATYTYKKVFGYHPLHIYWNGFIVNLAFHEGSEPPNQNNDLFVLLEETVKQIRKRSHRPVEFV